MATTKKTTAKAETNTEAFEQLTGVGADSFKEGYEKFAEGVSAVADFQKGSFEAFVASAGAFAKGFEKMTSEQAAFTKSVFEDTFANAKAASTSKNVQEAFDLNNDFVRQSVEKNLSQASKVADIWVETTKETAEPLTARYGELVEKIQAFRP